MLAQAESSSITTASPPATDARVILAPSAPTGPAIARLALHGRRRRRSDDLDAHAHRARSNHAEPARGRARHVDHPAAREGTAVVDADADRTAVGEIGDEHPRAERQRAMRGGELLPIEALAAGRRTTLEVVPGRKAHLDARWFLPEERAAELTDRERAHRHDRRPPHPPRLYDRGCRAVKRLGSHPLHPLGADLVHDADLAGLTE